MAIYRRCNKCGEKISIRQMPAGQWVAFDSGTDNPHRCEKRKKRKSSKGAQDNQSHTIKDKLSTAPQTDYDLDDWKDLPKSQPSWNWVANNKYAKDVLDAIRSKNRVEIVYSGGSKPMETRVIKPIEIFERAGNQYLSAYCCQKHDDRIFRFDKIISLRMCRDKGTLTQSPGETSTTIQPGYLNKTKDHSDGGKITESDTIIKTIGWVIFLLFLGYLLFY